MITKCNSTEVPKSSVSTNAWHGQHYPFLSCIIIAIITSNQIFGALRKQWGLRNGGSLPWKLWIRIK